MRKFLLLSFLMIWSVPLFAAGVTSVRLNPDTDIVVYGITNKTFALNYVESSGDATSSSAPAKIYVPMAGPLGTEASYFIASGVTTLFSASSTATTIEFPLYINATASDYYLYAAVKDGTNGYKLVAQSPYGPFNGTTNLDQNFSLSTKIICDQLSDCTNFATVSGTEKSYSMYFFLSTTSGLALGSVIDPATDTGGIFFEVNMSNRIYTSAQIAPSITSIKSGDKRVIITYSSNASILKPKAVRIYNYGGNPAGVGSLQPIQTSYASSGALTSTEYSYTASGEVTVAGLTNGSSNYFSVLFVDLYNFGTVLSDDQLGSPKEIEELLKQQACFLLTAGFGEEHYVISYFRNFRDTILAGNYLGKKFINSYYQLAPKYALIIYKHEAVRAGIRGAAYVLYFLFNYFYFLVLLGLGASVFIFYLKRRIKITY